MTYENSLKDTGLILIRQEVLSGRTANISLMEITITRHDLAIIHRIDKKWMVPVMSVKRELIKGTLILTAAGFAARLLGFF